MEVTTMPPASPDATSVPERAAPPQAAVVTTVIKDGVGRYALVTEPAELPASAVSSVGILALDLFTDEARLTVDGLLNGGWFEIDEPLAYVARIPSTRGTGRAAHRRGDA